MFLLQKFILALGFLHLSVTIDVTPSLGSGYSLDDESFHDPCFSGEVVNHGSESSTLFFELTDERESFQQELEAQSKLRIGSSLLGLEAQLNVVETSSYQRKVGYFHYSQVIQFFRVSFADYQITERGCAVFDKISRNEWDKFWEHPLFKKTCGDEVVDSYQPGGSVNFIIRIYAKEDVELSVIEYQQMIDVLFRKKKKKKTYQYRWDHLFEKVEIWVHQIGGDQAATKLELAKVYSCLPLDTQSCEERIHQVWSYINDSGPNGFFAQIQANPGLLWFSSKSYNKLAYFPNIE